MIFAEEPPPPPARARISALYRADEAACLEALLLKAALTAEQRREVERLARRLVGVVRAQRARAGGLDAFLHEYGLSTPEGIVLMCLAEALLRIPDAATANRLIKDKLGGADWRTHIGQSESLFVNASTWGLMLTGRVVRLDAETRGDATAFLGRMISRNGEPIIRQALNGAMRIMASQFVMGRSIEEAMDRADTADGRRYRYSFDMLGEAAHTQADAERYDRAYFQAIAALGARAGEAGAIHERPGISIKLSALHPRFEFAQSERIRAELGPRLDRLVRHARDNDIAVAIDAEEADRLDLTLDLFDLVFSDPRLDGWQGFGLVVQAYQKRALAVIDWIAARATARDRCIPVRLVKGAYWDTEIKRAQERGLEGYPVYTRKAATDVSYLACARALLAAPERIYPQFATHNAHHVAAIAVLAGADAVYEFQRLHGMGEALYDEVVAGQGLGRACRVYAPVGSHEDLLPYLVRRLLENGANTSFVNRIVDDAAPVDELIADPAERLAALGAAPHPRIPLPRDLYGGDRPNAAGLELNDPVVLTSLGREMGAAARPWTAAPLVGGVERPGPADAHHDPNDRRRAIGEVVEADAEAVEQALALAAAAARGWARTPAEARASALDRAAAMIEAERAHLMALAVREAGRTIPDALAEVREAADFCRYYAARAREQFAAPLELTGPTGETNRLSLHGRGVFACISPWNFPLAIFTGQVAAALAAGNAVIAKPAEQTPLMAAQAVRLLHRAGVPADVLHLLPGGGETVGAALIGDARIAGVAFTGSTETARLINRALAAREGPLVPLIAETGGQNAMIVDSSALPEQVVADVLRSAFNSAGQRCSALRVLFVQEDIAERVLTMLGGAMAELVIGDPALLSTDVGPVIDEAARATLEAHALRMSQDGEARFEAALGADCAHGTFVAPRLFEIASLDILEREVFGPILHVVRYAAGDLEAVCHAIDRTGFGLTLGLHSRIDTMPEFVSERVGIGNVYVNRDMIGAVVGVQPFGGEGLSGTGPKAGGPRYLARFATERARSVNTAATGGNVALLSLEDAG